MNDFGTILMRYLLIVLLLLNGCSKEGNIADYEGYYTCTCLTNQTYRLKGRPEYYHQQTQSTRYHLLRKFNDSMLEMTDYVDSFNNKKQSIYLLVSKDSFTESPDWLGGVRGKFSKGDFWYVSEINLMPLQLDCTEVSCKRL